MTLKVKCMKCSREFNCQQDLQNHMDRKFPCDKAKYNCKKCNRGLNTLSSKYVHEKNCKGKTPTISEKDEQIQSLKNVIAATSGLNANIHEKQQKIIQNIQNQNNVKIDIDTINQVTQNIVIMPVGRENIKHLKDIPIEELKNKIQFDRDPKTHIDAFKLIRLDPDHPENQNILLTERDSDTVHFYTDNNKWQEGEYLYQIRNAIYDVNKNIQELILYQQRENSEYYWNHLVKGIGGHCNARNDHALKPIFDGIRDPLHQATLRLMKMAPEEFAIEMKMSMNSSDSSMIQQQIELARERSREAEMRQLEAVEKTKQLEIELELARFRRVGN